MTGIHEEIDEEELNNKFAEYGPIKTIVLNVDRRTGFFKGYALIEYENYKSAATALEEVDGTDFYGQKISVNWCFVKGPSK